MKSVDQALEELRLTICSISREKLEDLAMGLALKLGEYKRQEAQQQATVKAAMDEIAANPTTPDDVRRWQAEAEFDELGFDADMDGVCWQ